MKEGKRSHFNNDDSGFLVVVRENETLESAIKRFKKKVDDEGILKTWREKQYFQKPSAKKRLKQKESARKEVLRQSTMDKKLSFRDTSK